MVNFLDQITLFSDKQVLVTIGPKVIILKELNYSIPLWIFVEKKPKDVICYKDLPYVTLSVEVLDPEWVVFLFLKSEKNIQKDKCVLSQFSHLQKYLILLLNHIMLLFQFINLSKMLMKFKLSIMKPFMISVSEPLNSPPQPMVT